MSPAATLQRRSPAGPKAEQRVRDILPDEADALLQGRVAFFNVWKPLYQRVEELPLPLNTSSKRVAASSPPSREIPVPQLGACGLMDFSTQLRL